MKLIRQFDRMDCGPACVCMIASHYGRRVSLPYVRTLCGLTREGVSIAGIRKALEVLGFESVALKMTTAQLQQDCPLPAVLYWEQRHFVVLEKVTKNGKYVICDPEAGRCKYTPDDFARKWLNGENGVVVAAQPASDLGTSAGRTRAESIVDFARRYVFPYKAQLFQALCALAVGMLIGLLLPLLTKVMVDDGVGGRDFGLIADILVAQLALYAGQAIMTMTGSWVALYMSTRISVAMVGDFLRRLIILPASYFDTKTPGDHQQRINDHGRLQTFLTSYSLEFLFSLVSIPFCVALTAFYSPAVSVVFLAFTLAAFGWTAYFFRRRRRIDHEQFAINARNQNHVYEIIDGITDIKLNGLGNWKLRDWEDLQQQRYRLNQKALKLSQIQTAGYNLLTQARNILVTGVMALSVVGGQMTMGMMIAVTAIIGMVAAPLAQAVAFMQQYQDARISLERASEVHMVEPEETPDQKGMPTLAVNSDIKFTNVTFSYAPGLAKPVIDDVSLVIPAGKMTAIVGESGSGKTTLVKLLLKLYTPTSGCITVGPQDITQIAASALRGAFGIVMQECHLFSDTLMRNITMDNDMDYERMRSAINTACLDDFVASHPLGLHRALGTEGTGVSGGERQRIMIARAVYKKPSCLILDEATSSLDAETEARITHNLDDCFAATTRIVIAHRLSTVRNADHIIVMHRGRVVESGTHMQLIEREGYYFNLIRNQLELAAT